MGEIKLNIKNTEETLVELSNNNVSMVRFGDGEFILMRCGRIGFQKRSLKLARRLREVLFSDPENNPNCLIGIPATVCNMDNQNEEAKEYWKYFFRKHRWIFKKLNKGNRIFYDSLVTRPYIDYADKSRSKEVFARFCKLWEHKDVLIVEGEKSRIGVGNDLFAGAKSIRRIIGPATDAFSRYDEILNAVMGNADKNTLIVLALGPTATVLGYDLSKMGYRALDTGHLDLEYEWFLGGAKEKVKVEGKFTNEAQDGDNVEDIVDETYESQIVWKYNS
ncbi:MAG: SP_1767 family glycosyltransferase [Lachnospiraceae bacterium]|nr:SP_1767 family glycosyltransferase [Lachnospiraceae bacterium]